MFKEKDQNSSRGNVEKKFIVCYDKFTKPMALSLWNSLKKESSCGIWSKKVYESNEPTLSNRNKIILLNEDLIKTNLANPSIQPINFSKGVLIKHESNTIGIYIDPNANLVSFKETFKESWLKYIVGIVIPILTIGGIPISFAATLAMYNKEKNQVKFRLLFDAVNKLKTNDLEKFLQNE